MCVGECRYRGYLFWGIQETLLHIGGPQELADDSLRLMAERAPGKLGTCGHRVSLPLASRDTL